MDGVSLESSEEVGVRMESGEGVGVRLESSKGVGIRLKFEERVGVWLGGKGGLGISLQLPYRLVSLPPFFLPGTLSLSAQWLLTPADGV